MEANGAGTQKCSNDGVRSDETETHCGKLNGFQPVNGVGCGVSSLDKQEASA